MKEMRRRLAAVLLGLSLVPALAACGSGGGGTEAGGTVYTPSFVRCEAGMEQISAGCANGETLYILGTAENDGRTTIRRVALDGTTAPLENYVPLSGPEAAENFVNINNLRPGADGTLWVTEELTSTTFQLPVGFDEASGDKWDYQVTETTRVQRQLDGTGRELRRVDLEELSQRLGGAYVNSAQMDGEDRLYALTDRAVAVLDEKLETLFTTGEEDGLFGDLLQLGDGTMALSSWSDTGSRVLRTIDPAAKNWGPEYTLPSGADAVYPGSGKYLFCYERGDSLWGCAQGDLQAGTETGGPLGTELLQWSGVDVDRDDLAFFAFLPDGRMAAVTNSREGGPGAELVLLTETDRSSIGEKSVLTFATLNLDSQTRGQIINFNRSNGKYRIEIRDYSGYGTDGDNAAGLTKLNTEIAAGNVPDILDARGLPIRQYGAKGILEDLWPYIEKDPDIGRAGLVESVFRAAQQDGKLYQVFDSFTIATAAGDPKVVGDRMSWTLDELLAALQTMPEGCQIFGEGNTKNSMLELSVLRSLDRFVDWEKGQCSFDSQEFIDALRLCDTFPLEFDWSKVDWESYQTDFERLRAGKQMLYSEDLMCFEDMQMLDTLFGGKAAFVGYPTDGGCGSAFRLDRGRVMALSSTCRDKEGAWSFLRELLLPQESGEEWFFCFPANRRDFDAMAEKAMRREMVEDENGAQVELAHGGVPGTGFSLDFYAMTQEQLDRFNTLCDAIDTTAESSDGVADIVRSAAQAFFNGDESAEETARQIQSRVKLYLGEQS